MNGEQKSVVNTCSFKLKYNQALQIKFFSATSWILFNLDDDSSNDIFTGAIAPTFGLRKRNNVMPISIEAVDNSYLLDELFTVSFNFPSTIGGSEYQIFNADNSSSNLIWELLDDAGYTPASDIASGALDITTTVEYFQGTEGEETYREYIDTLLSEYGWVFFFNASGKFNVFQWDKNSISSTFTVDEDIEVRKNNVKEDGFEVEFAQTDVDSAALLFRDSLPVQKVGEQYQFTGQAIANNDYYPPDSDINDIWQRYVVKYLDKPYLSRETRLKNKDITLIAAEASDESVGFIADDGIDIVDSEYESGRARVSFRNTSGGVASIYNFEIRGTALYRKYRRTTKSPSTSTRPKKYVARFLHDTTLSTVQANATRFADAKYNIIANGTFIYTWGERTDRNTGDIGTINITDPSISQTIVIVEKRFNPDITYRTYTGIGISAYSAQTVESTGESPDTTTTSQQANADLNPAHFVQSAGVIYGGAPSTSTWLGVLYGGSPSTTFVEDETGGLPPSDGSLILTGDLYAKQNTIFNANYVFEDSDTRTIKIGPSFGIIARDGRNVIIHDLPDAIIQDTNFYCGHLIHFNDDDAFLLYSSSAYTEGVWTEVTCISNGNSNVKAGLFQIAINSRHTSLTYDSDQICTIALRPNGTSWGAGSKTPLLSRTLTLNFSETIIFSASLSGQLICPIGDDFKIEFFASVRPDAGSKAITIAQLGVFI
jgi:hypothetical protein